MTSAARLPAAQVDHLRLRGGPEPARALLGLSGVHFVAQSASALRAVLATSRGEVVLESG